MKITRQAQCPLRTGLGVHQRRGQSWQQITQVRSTVEAVGGFGQIAASVLGLAHRMAHPAAGAFGVGQHQISPAGAFGLGRRTTASGD